MQKWSDYEAALALAQAELGIRGDLCDRRILERMAFVICTIRSHSSNRFRRIS